MARTAKLFRIGRSQAVRLPSDFRFDGDEVFIHRDPATGDVILSQRPNSWDSFFALTQEPEAPADYMTQRHDQVAQKRKLFRWRADIF